MSIKTKNSQIEEASQLRQAAIGVTKHLSNPNYTMLEVSYTPTSLTAKLNTYGDQVAAITTGEQNLKNLRAALKIDNKAIRGLLAAVHWQAEAELGPTSPLLSDFGFTPAKIPIPKPATAIVARTTKSNTTRKVLGTKGAKQKLAALAAAAAIPAATAATATASSTTPAAAPPALALVSNSATPAPQPAPSGSAVAQVAPAVEAVPAAKAS